MNKHSVLKTKNSGDWYLEELENLLQKLFVQKGLVIGTYTGKGRIPGIIVTNGSQQIFLKKFR